MAQSRSPLWKTLKNGYEIFGRFGSHGKFIVYLQFLLFVVCRMSAKWFNCGALKPLGDETASFLVAHSCEPLDYRSVFFFFSVLHCSFSYFITKDSSITRIRWFAMMKHFGPNHLHNNVVYCCTF